MKSYDHVKNWMGPVFRFLFPYKVYGIENVPMDGAVIVCGNHSSNLDPLYLVACLPRQVHFLAKAEIFKKPFIRHLAIWIGAIPVKRGEKDMEAIKQSLRTLRDKNALGIFPEGTRVVSGKESSVKSGVAMFAYKTKAPVLPVAIYTKPSKIKFFHKSVILIGNPIFYEELGFHVADHDEFKKISAEIMRKVYLLRESASTMR